MMCSHHQEIGEGKKKSRGKYAFVRSDSIPKEVKEIHRVKRAAKRNNFKKKKKQYFEKRFKKFQRVSGEM